MNEEMKNQSEQDEETTAPAAEEGEEKPLTSEAPEAAGEQSPAAETAEAEESRENVQVAEESGEETPSENDPESVEEATRVFAVQEVPNKLDGILLACKLCEAVRLQVGAEGFHGGVRPDNISVNELQVKLGSPLEHGVGEFTPQELEYMSPELFWDGNRSGETDVYSIGLILYAVYNHGLMPFWPVDGEATPNIRAAALQRRMNREEITPPASAGSELSEIILRSLAFTPEERFSNVDELANALNDCREEQPLATDFASVLSGMMERSTRRSEKKDEISSPFVSKIGDEPDKVAAEEEPIPKVKVRRSDRRLAQILVYIALGLSVVAVVLLLRRCVALDEEARVTPTPPVATVKEPSEEEKIISGEVSAEPQPTEEPEEEPLVVNTPEPQSKVEYVAVKENVSWSEAVKRCEEMGGTLAMPTNYEEFQTITAECEKAGITFVWLNAQRNAEGAWVDDQGKEDAFFFAWGDGEPSETDSGDGAAEDYFLLWNRNGRWCGNDSRENPLTSFANVYGGKIGYVCKKISYESVNITDLGG